MRPSDHELGRRIRSICLRNSGPGSNRTVLAAAIADLLEGDTFLLIPLRDLVCKPAFQTLVASDSSSSVLMAKEAILADLRATYHPSVTSRLSGVVEGILGSDAASDGSWSGYGADAVGKERDPRTDPVGVGVPASDVPPRGGRKAVMGVSCALAGVAVALVGGFVLGRGVHLAAPRVSEGGVETRGASQAPRQQPGEECAYQEKVASELRHFRCVITHFQAREGAVGTKIEWEDGEVSRYVFTRDGAFQSWYKGRPDRGVYAIAAEPGSGRTMLRLKAVLDGDVTWLPMASLPWRS